MSAAFAVPAAFMTVPYIAGKYPGNAVGLADGANCQHFAYEILRYFGYSVPNFRSSDLWEDTVHSERPANLEPFDLLLFNRTTQAYGAHVALCCGDGLFLHLCKEVGHPAFWRIEEFTQRERYAMLVGGKRLRSAAGHLHNQFAVA